MRKYFETLFCITCFAFYLDLPQARADEDLFIAPPNISLRPPNPPSHRPPPPPPSHRPPPPPPPYHRPPPPPPPYHRPPPPPPPHHRPPPYHPPSRPYYPPTPPPYYPPPRSYSAMLSCFSINRGYNECYVRGYIQRAGIYEQYSRTRCEYGYSWGFYRDRIWVDHGCRAHFWIDDRPY